MRRSADGPWSPKKVRERTEPRRTPSGFRVELPIDWRSGRVPQKERVWHRGERSVAERGQVKNSKGGWAEIGVSKKSEKLEGEAGGKKNEKRGKKRKATKNGKILEQRTDSGVQMCGAWGLCAAPLEQPG